MCMYEYYMYVTALTQPNISVAPSKPHWMETDSVSSSSVTLKWVPPTYPNGVVIKYSVHFDGKHIDGFGDKVSDMLRGTVEGLSPDSEYVFEVKAYTKVGPGPSVDLSVRTRELFNIYNQIQYVLYTACTVKHCNLY